MTIQFSRQGMAVHKKAGRFAFQAEIRGRCLSLSGCP
jgi:hypothetical protein